VPGHVRRLSAGKAMTSPPVGCAHDLQAMNELLPNAATVTRAYREPP
jgi:hypothetical protein